MGERCGVSWGVRGYCGERGFFGGVVGGKKCLLKPVGVFGERCGGVMGREGEYCGERALFRGGGAYLPMPYLSRRRSKMRAAGLTKISRNTAFDSM